MKIKFPAEQLSRFQRRAIRRYPKEYGELLYGEVRRGKPVIKEFVSGPYVASAGHWMPTKVEPSFGSYVFLGAIHSHPGVNDCSPSEADWEWAQEAGMWVHAISAVGDSSVKPRARTLFFLGRALLDARQKNGG